MPKTIFLSHNAKDKPLADIIADNIKQVSIAQVKAWFSSDDKIDGGFNAGDNWYTEIHRKIDKSDILIALITQNSIDRPWLYYEAGIANGMKKIVVPVCIGIKRENIKSPLRELQGYQLTDKKSYEEFLERILLHLKFPLDKKNFKKPIEKAILTISNYKFEDVSIKEVSIEDVLENFKSYIDSKLDFQRLPHGKKIKTVRNIDNSTTYSIKFKLQLKKDAREFITEISENDTFQAVTNNIYFNFQDIIKPFTYLEKWVIIDNKTKNYLVIREIASQIPAKYAFQKNRNFTIKLLSKPYRSIDSKPRL
jgi:hypothetical protein